MPILHDVTLACLLGQTTAIVGRSGAGKSTLLKLVNRLLRPTAGLVRVQGRDTREWDPIRLRRSAGYVMQDAGLFPHMTVAENVGVVPRLEGWDEPRVQARSRELLDLVGLGKWMHHRPYELSGGQQQRVAIARAVANRPRLILADEPTGELDSTTAREILTLFRNIVKHENLTVLMSSHDPLVDGYVDKIFQMKDGQIINNF